MERSHLSVFDNRHDNLAFTRSVTCDVPGELFHIRNQLREFGRSSRSAHASAESDGLARDLALEWPKDELARIRRIREVES